MNNIPNNPVTNNYNDEIDIRELFLVLIEKKWIIFSVTSFVAIIGIIYSLMLPNIYESKALLSPVDETSSSLPNIGGLAGLAGIDIKSGSSDNSVKATVTLRSLSFFENNVLPNIYLPNLMAVESWNPDTNIITYDESIYLESSKKWVRDYSHPYKQIPSAQEAFEVFINQHFNLTEDISTGFLTLTIKHQSPFISQQWAELLVDQVNAFYREKDRSESEKAANYLYQQISMTSLSEVKEAVAELVQEETKKLAVIEAKQQYVYDYIDPPAVMELKSEPRRALIVILSALLGFIASTLFVFAKYFPSRATAS